MQWWEVVCIWVSGGFVGWILGGHFRYQTHFIKNIRYRYRFRNVVLNNPTHYIKGTFVSAAIVDGVLEHCDSLTDAKSLREHMRRDPRFSNLKIIRIRETKKTEEKS